MVILAGGGGTRLWPWSRHNFPKQFLHFGDHESLLQKTIKRCAAYPGTEEILISTNRQNQGLVREQVCKAALHQVEMVVEPCARNTAPAIALSVKYVEEVLGGQGVVFVLPSDHFIEPQEVFVAHLKRMEELAKEGKIALFGICPTRAETGYGYIEVGKELEGGGYEVHRFVEKPTRERAEEFLKTGRFFWNAGMFAFSVTTFWEEMERYAPQIGSMRKMSLQECGERFSEFPHISIDYALIEKSQKVAMCPLPVRWSDVGSWDSVYETLEKDGNQNVKRGNVRDIDTKGSLIFGGRRLITTIGLENLLIVETEDALFISKKGESQRVKGLTENLRTVPQRVEMGKTAIVHDWLLSSVGGSEKVVEAIHRLFPSPIFTLLSDQERLKGSYFEGCEIFSSFLQKMPFAKRQYKNYLPLFPLAIELMDLSEYEVIFSSSHCAAKGVITRPDQLHICYCHTPMRYAWDLMHEYLEGMGRLKRGLVAWLLQRLRAWDVASASRADLYVANSRYVAERIRKCYGREAEVIYPPVDLGFFEMREKKEDFYLTASRLVGYKKIDVIVEAFAEMPDRKLVVIGEGPEREQIRKKARGNLEVMGAQSDEVLRDYLQRARAFIFAAVEDFGILPVEAMGCGTPVIALRRGGVLETVGELGTFFDEVTPGAIREAVREFEKREIDPREWRRRAERFSKERFAREFQELVNREYLAKRERAYPQKTAT